MTAALPCRWGSGLSCPGGSGDVTLAGRRLSENRRRPIQARVHLRGHLVSGPPLGGPR